LIDTHVIARLGRVQEEHAQVQVGSIGRRRSGIVQVAVRDELAAQKKTAGLLKPFSNAVRCSRNIAGAEAIVAVWTNVTVLRTLLCAQSINLGSCHITGGSFTNDRDSVLQNA